MRGRGEMIEAAPVVLVTMPWASVRQPSLQLGILGARLAQAGIDARALYANLELAERIGLDTYEEYSSFHNIVSDWVFSGSLFPERDARENGAAVRRFHAFAAEEGCGPRQIAEIERIRREIPSFLGWAMEAIDWARVRVAGFTTTMMQPVPALALARALKARHPHLRILLGGAGCSGPMGRAIHRLFPFVDGVVDGEADLTIAPLVQALLRGEEPRGIAGLSWRDQSGACAEHAPAPTSSLDDYPAPMYDDYFEQLEGRSYAASIEPRVPFEASRGCWWAVRNHCLFCGLNGEVVAQRARKVPAVIDELGRHRERYGARTFVATDNIIDPRHLVHLPRALAEALPGVEVFFEVRAVMTRAQMRGLARGGVVHLQPGLESLVAEVLEMVKKGTTPIVNLCFLRRADELGLSAYWNLLYGFPGEQRAWYDDLLERLPLFFHLRPPDVVEFSLERFSPYFREPERYGIKIKGPLPGYRHVWDLPDEAIQELCFDLDFEASTLAHRAELGADLRAAVAAWTGSGAVLTATLLGDGRVRVLDTRPVQMAGAWHLDALDGLILRGLEAPSTLGRLGERLRRSAATGYLRLGGEKGARRRVESLAQRGLVYAEGGEFLSLVVPESAGFWLGDDQDEVREPRAQDKLIALVGKQRPRAESHQALPESVGPQR